MCTVHFVPIYALYLLNVWRIEKNKDTNVKNKCLILPTKVLTSFKEYILVKKECLAFLEQKGKNNGSTSDLDVTTMPQHSVPQSDKELDILVDDTVDVSFDAWLKFGALYLFDSDRETLMNGEWLNDAHM